MLLISLIELMGHALVSDSFTLVRCLCTDDGDFLQLLLELCPWPWEQPAALRTVYLFQDCGVYESPSYVLWDHCWLIAQLMEQHCQPFLLVPFCGLGTASLAMTRSCTLLPAK